MKIGDPREVRIDSITFLDIRVTKFVRINYILSMSRPLDPIRAQFRCEKHFEFSLIAFFQSLVFNWVLPTILNLLCLLKASKSSWFLIDFLSTIFLSMVPHPFFFIDGTFACFFSFAINLCPDEKLARFAHQTNTFRAEIYCRKCRPEKKTYKKVAAGRGMGIGEHQHEGICRAADVRKRGKESGMIRLYVTGDFRELCLVRFLVSRL